MTDSRWHGFTHRPLHKLGIFLLILLGGLAIFADFLSPYPPEAYVVKELLHPSPSFGPQPPQAIPPVRVHLFDGAGRLQWPYICKRVWEQVILQGGFQTRWRLREDCSQIYPIRLLVRDPTYRYKFLGLFETDLHLFKLSDPKAPLILLGTDGRGRDLLARLLVGSRVSLGISTFAVLLGLLLALPLGALSGYFGGRADMMIQRVVEGTLAFPRLALLLVVATAIRGAGGRLAGLILLLALAGWAPLARMLRAQVLALREEVFIEAAKAMGASHRHIVIKHILPHVAGTIIASATLTLPNLLMLESFLSYLGYGVPETLPSWGLLLNEIKEVHLLPSRPWLLLAAIPIALTALACTLVGEALRERFDPFKYERR